MIGLCDCNNFFASCERVFRPDLNGKPVVVLSNNDGCIVARSNEAKALGIKMGTPLFQARDVIEKHNVAVFSSNYQLYGDLSNRVMNVLRSAVPQIEIYSIDEAFLDVREFRLENLQQSMQELSARVLREVGIPVSIGVAPTKTLAKIASKLCKRYPALKGACLMYKKADVEKVLGKFPVEDVWGIGRKSAKKLLALGVHTALEFYNLTPATVNNKFTISGLRTWKELHGVPCINFEDTHADRQTVCVSRSFAKEMRELEELDAAIATFTAKMAEKLRRDKLFASQMSVFILTNRFHEDEPQHYQIHTTLFEVATNDTLEMSQAASEMLKKIFRKGYGYKKAGVMATDIVPMGCVQGSLTDTLDRTRRGALMEIMDTINKTAGCNTIRLASQGTIDQFSSRTMTSRRYTTSWDELMEVKC